MIDGKGQDSAAVAIDAEDDVQASESVYLTSAGKTPQQHSRSEGAEELARQALAIVERRRIALRAFASHLERVPRSSNPTEEAPMSMQGPGGEQEPPRPGEDMPDPSPSAPEEPSRPTSPLSSPDEPDVEAPGSPEQEPNR